MRRVQHTKVSSSWAIHRTDFGVEKASPDLQRLLESPQPTLRSRLIPSFHTEHKYLSASLILQIIHTFTSDILFKCSQNESWWINNEKQSEFEHIFVSKMIFRRCVLAVNGLLTVAQNSSPPYQHNTQKERKKNGCILPWSNELLIYLASITNQGILVRD